jgi:hypothetical protein
MTMKKPDWRTLVLGHAPPAAAWDAMLAALAAAAVSATSPTEIENACIEGDALLADAAWELWRAYAASAECAHLRTSARMRDWWDQAGPSGRAVLVLDAMSLRELPALLEGADAHGMEPSVVAATGAPVPTTTNAFAHELGIPSAGNLKGNGAAGSFKFKSGQTEKYDHVPFADMVHAVTNQPDVFFWHDLVDAQLHVASAHSQLFNTVTDQLRHPDFWRLVARLRQGRRLLVTSDHGYAIRASARDILSDSAKALVRAVMGGSHATAAKEPLPAHVWPSLLMTANEHHVVVGNRKWRAPGAREVSHGGLSLLEVAVPWVEFQAS